MSDVEYSSSRRVEAPKLCSFRGCPFRSHRNVTGRSPSRMWQEITARMPSRSKFVIGWMGRILGGTGIQIVSTHYLWIC